MNTPTIPSSVHFGHQGRVVIVTGGAQGIGEACVRRFAREGASLVIADVADAPGSALARELGATYMHCDVGDKLDVDAVVAKTVAGFGRIDVLVNNAGIFKAADFLEVSEDDFDEVLRVNLKGSFLMGQAVARVMAAAGRGSIVNMSSVNGTLAIPTIASYNVSKGGINQLTRVMALALADKGVRVNAVAPCARTRMVKESPTVLALMPDATGFDRHAPEHVAPLVVYLASSLCRFTGRVFAIEGPDVAVYSAVGVAQHWSTHEFWTPESLAEIFRAVDEQSTTDAFFPGGVVQHKTPSGRTLRTLH